MLASHSGPEQILIIAPSWIGDMVMAQPVLARLHEQGDVHIDVLALPWIKPVLTPWTPGIVPAVSNRQVPAWAI
jgi:ADP-heptose:LPS heptosyltransferase